MHPLVRGAVAVAVLSALSSAPELQSRPRTVLLVRTVDATEGGLSAVCPKGSLPDSTRCVPLPESRPHDQRAGSSKEVGARRDRSGQWRVYEQIPRRPDRPADYRKYRYPIDPPNEDPWFLSGYDPDGPNPHAGQGRGFGDTGHGGVDLAQSPGAPVRAIRLPDQRGDAQVVFIGGLLGTTVVTRHSITEAGRTRDYLLIHGYLDSTNPDLGPGAVATEGTLLGTVGATQSQGRAQLHFEVRQVRDGVKPSRLRSSSLADGTVSIACDPRNILPLVTKPEQSEQ